MKAAATNAWVSNEAPSRVAHYLALGASICFGVIGQLLMKSAALGSIADPSALAVLPRLALALTIYGLGVASWMFALRAIKLSVAYSLSSLNYVGILFGAYYGFGESIGPWRVAGVVLIFLGVALVVVKSPRDGPR